ncbi:acyltransferase family protein [Nocardioides dilutus]
MDAGSPGGGPAPAGSADAADRRASTRHVYVDNLKTLLIGAIIVVHAVLGYADALEVWTYTEFREVTLTQVTQVALFVVAGPFGLFVIPLFFLVAGLLTPGSLDRKGTKRFVSDRLLRLGVPFLVYVLLVQPGLKYALVHQVGSSDGPYRVDSGFWDLYLVQGRLDTGPLWFVGVLLVFSLAYAGSRRLTTSRSRSPRDLTVGRLLLLAAAIAPVSFAVRLLWPYGSESGFTDLNFWEWPACAAVFVLGTRGARGSLATAVPAPLLRGSRTATLLAAGAMAMLTALAVLLDRVDDALGGWSWPAAAFAAVEAVLTLTGSIWLLGVAQRRLDRRFRGDRVLNRAAYGAFMLQTVFLLGIAVLIRPLELPAEVKAVVVAIAAVASSFAAAHLLIHRVPGVQRLL